MKKILTITAIISIAVWGMNLVVTPPPVWNVWVVRKELINLTGIISFSYMALIMLLAVRPKWLEKSFDGLDKMYWVHKWAGIWAIGLGGVHYLLKLSGPHLLIFFFERPVRGPRTESFFGQFRGVAEQVAEWTIYLLLISLVLTLWHKFSYRVWRYTHKIMPVIFLALVFHVIILSPETYWTQPAGLVVGLGCLVGSVCAFLSLFGLIGKQSSYKGKVISIETPAKGIIDIVCHLQGNWQHKAGQYVFLKQDKIEGAHPFTISSADQGNNTLHLCIKDLGDYTRHLQSTLKINDPVTIEGPYGCFDFKKSGSAHQIWIAGGIGITPFIAWLESLQNTPDKDRYAADLYYSIRNATEAGFVSRLENLCKTLPGMHLHVQYSDSMGYLTVDKLNLAKNDKGQYPDIWFCGSGSFAKALKSDLMKKEFPPEYFHQELFEMR